MMDRIIDGVLKVIFRVDVFGLFLVQGRWIRSSASLQGALSGGGDDPLPFHVSTWNLNSLNGKLEKILQLGKSVVAIQEARVDERRAKMYANQAAGQAVCHFGPGGRFKLCHKSCPGVAMAVHACWPSRVGHVPVDLQHWYDERRSQAVDGFDGARWLNIWNVYAPAEGKEKPLFLLQLGDAFAKFCPDILLGDFNSELSCEDWYSHVQILKYRDAMQQVGYPPTFQ